MRHQQGLGAGVEEGPGEAGQSRRPGGAVRGGRIAGRQDDPVGVEFELHDLRGREQPVVCFVARGWRCEHKRGFCVGLAIAALLRVQVGDVVQARRYVGMIGAKFLPERVNDFAPLEVMSLVSNRAAARA